MRKNYSKNDYLLMIFIFKNKLIKKNKLTENASLNYIQMHKKERLKKRVSMVSSYCSFDTQMILIHLKPKLRYINVNIGNKEKNTMQ